MRKPPVALWIWYRGDPYNGFQAQPTGSTVQQVLEEALAEIGITAGVVAAGRTDKGVHARMQVIRVRSRDLSPDELRESLKGRLPSGLGICASHIAPAHFHPQWRCTFKEYRYRLCLERPPPIDWQTCVWTPRDHPRLDGRRVRPEDLAPLISQCAGTRDFGAFHENSSVRRWRTLHSADLIDLKNGIFDVRFLGNGFGRYQVRYLVGSAVAAAAGVLSREAFLDAVGAGGKIQGLKAPAKALVLWDVAYHSSVDPFSEAERRAPPGLPSTPPFLES
jgi:tRNA pseudouridine38-40 synthase